MVNCSFSKNQTVYKKQEDVSMPVFPYNSKSCDPTNKAFFGQTTLAHKLIVKQ